MKHCTQWSKFHSTEEGNIGGVQENVGQYLAGRVRSLMRDI